MEDLSRYYALLKDPTRRKIIEILGTQDKIGFKELRNTLGSGVGTVYYHLDMLSDFIEQDRQRKYRLNDRGRLLYKVMMEGNVPAPIEINKTFSHSVGKWIFLSPAFSKTVGNVWFLPISIGILFFGALGSAYAQLEPALFFYFQYPSLNPTGIVALYFFNWLTIFIFAEVAIYLLYRRTGNDLQLLSCIALASFPIASYPYVFMLFSFLFLPITGVQYISVVLQIWTLLLISAALSFGKGIRLDRGIIISLTAMYLNIAILFLQGRF